jgi:DNA recombination protein Rad52
MSGFSKDQLKKLVGKLDRAKIQTREIEGRKIDYIEGWFAMSEANLIFGYAGWDREMAQFERIFERTRGERTSCGYLARVRIRVRAGDVVIVREGTGFGQAWASVAGDAHERALKAAETDATKRALATFGNRFGLSLYDKEQSGITGARAKTDAPLSDSNRGRSYASSSPNQFPLRTEDSTLLAEHLSPEGFCSGLRQLVERAQLAAEIEGLRRHNREAIAALRELAPGLKTLKGKHYADVLDDLLDGCAKRLANSLRSNQGNEERRKAIQLPQVEPSKTSRIAPGPAIDKSALALASTRRIRNKAHLAMVAAEPCLVCEQVPAHAHHLTFAQPRGLSVKVSDEFAVPLCALHHNDLHRARGEEAWWRITGIDPLAAALLLWQKTLAIALPDSVQAIPQTEQD